MENQSKFIERISEEFISYKSVERTYSGISFDPEKRAKSLQREFAQSCNEFADKLEIVCTTDEQKDEAKILFADYAEKRKAKFLAWASSMSRCLSPMITGPANFPVRRNEKANVTERKRLEEYLYYVDNTHKKIIKEIKNINKAETLTELTEANIKTINEELETVLGIVKGELPYTKTLIVDAMLRRLNRMTIKERQYAINKAKEMQQSNGVLLFNSIHKFWKIADIPQVETKTEETPICTPESTEETIYEADGIRIINNYLAERVQIMTDSKPEATQIDWLKKNGFKWSPSNKAWQRQNTANGKFAVKQYIHKFHNSESK